MSDQHQGERPFREVKRFWALYRPFLPVFASIAGLNAGVQLSDLATLYIFGAIIDAIVAARSSQETLRLIAIMLVTSVAGICFRQAVRIYSLRHLDYSVASRTALDAWSRIFFQSLGETENSHSGYKYSVISRGLQATDALARTIAHEGLFVSLRILITTGAVCVLYPICGLTLIVGIACFFIVTWRLNGTFRPGFRDVQQAAIKRDKLQLEFAQNVNLIQVNAQENRVLRELKEVFRLHTDVATAVYTRFHSWGIALHALPVICRVVIMLEGVLLVHVGHIRAGGLVTCMLWSSDTLSRLEWMNSINQVILERLTAIKGHLSFLDRASPAMITNPSSQGKGILGRIEFRNVSFRYPLMNEDDSNGLNEDNGKTRGRWALRDVSFTVESGEGVVIVGPSGAGKSTLLKLLLRAYDPDEGAILLDGVDLRQLELSALRQAIGVVEQHVVLLDRSLRENILFGLNTSQGGSAGEVGQDVLDAAQLAELVNKLPGGLDGHIGENGARMSGGERQRIGIARALAKEPTILFFDEATSQLDATNERLVRQAIVAASHSRTVLVIAHQVQSFIDSPRLLVFHDASLIGDGTHEELVRSCDWYRTMMNFDSPVLLAKEMPHTRT